MCDNWQSLYHLLNERKLVQIHSSSTGRKHAKSIMEADLSTVRKTQRAELWNLLFKFQTCS